MRFLILTTDREWSAANGEPVADDETVITVPDAAVEPDTFAGRDMFRFDLRTVAPSLPADWPNPWAMLPASRVVTD